MVSLRKPNREIIIHLSLGGGDEISPETRPFQFGDTLEQIDFTASIRNAQINHGIDSFKMYEDDLEIRETDLKRKPPPF